MSPTVANRLAVLGLCAGLVALSAFPAQVVAEPQPSKANLLDFWLARKADQQPMPTDWSYAYVGQHADDAAFRQRRLDAEIEGLALAVRLGSHAPLSGGIREWRQALEASPSRRAPGRVDIAWLAAHPRHVPSLAELDQIGFCNRPAWVEVWSTDGVARLDWQSGMQSGDLLDVLPERATDLAESAALVSPLGDIQRFGIAPWNYTTMPVAPGSRLWLDLPDDLAPGQATITRWLNTTMPETLATQLPGDDCTTLWQRNTAMAEPSE